MNLSDLRMVGGRVILDPPEHHKVTVTAMNKVAAASLRKMQEESDRAYDAANPPVMTGYPAILAYYLNK